jgi:dienelactone hydrolase
VPGGEFSLRSLPPVALDPFFLDTYEVTNRQFKDFVDAGGYTRRELWKVPFVRNGRSLSWDEARALMLDATGRPGPASWELGSYPEGREDWPVRGVSWYEAAAYAEFAGKSLPTIYHWYKAAGVDNFSQILQISNYGEKGPAKVGTYPGISPDGAYDMAGNVKEWCWNESEGRRHLVGGAFSEPNYTFLEANAQDPFDRSPKNGFRCARYEKPIAEALERPAGDLSRDYNKEKPVSDQVFALFRSFYEYDKTPLDARDEGPLVEEAYWRKQKVSFAAAYGDERVPAYLFLPKNAKPPYRTVVYFPSNVARMTNTSEDMDLRHVDFVVRSGRAVLFPIYQDIYERRLEVRPTSPNLRRDLVIQWSKDLGRSIDYLETRKDIDHSTLAYLGSSLGAIDGVTLVAIEPRIKSAIFLLGGLRFVRLPPEIEPVNFAPRVKVPTLLITGRYDFGTPYETSQAPLFRLLGAPEKDKKHVVYEGGHVPTQLQPLIKEMLDWLDRYQGKVG